MRYATANTRLREARFAMAKLQTEIMDSMSIGGVEDRALFAGWMQTMSLTKLEHIANSTDRSPTGYLDCEREFAKRAIQIRRAACGL